MSTSTRAVFPPIQPHKALPSKTTLPQKSYLALAEDRTSEEDKSRIRESKIIQSCQSDRLPVASSVQFDANLAKARKFMREKHVSEITPKIISFLEEFLNIKFKQQCLQTILADGSVLCRCIERVRGSRKPLKYHPKTRNQFERLDNFAIFFKACESMRINCAFDGRYLQEENDMYPVISCLQSIAKAAIKLGICKHQDWVNDTPRTKNASQQGNHTYAHAQTQVQPFEKPKTRTSSLSMKVDSAHSVRRESDLTASSTREKSEQRRSCSVKERPPQENVQPSSARKSVLDEEDLLPSVDRCSIAQQRPKSAMIQKQDVNPIHQPVINRLSRTKSMKDKVVQEIIKTEQDYVGDLEIIIQEFAMPVRGAIPSMPALLNEAFYMIESIHRLHSLILSELKIEGGGVGACFCKYGAGLKMYSSYCAIYESISQSFKQSIDNSPGFRKIIKAIEQRTICRGLDFLSFMIKPVQRICKYPILFKELLHCTNGGDEDYHTIQEALRKLSDYASGVNEKVRWIKNNERFQEITFRLEGYGEGFLIPSRHYVWECKVKVPSKDMKLKDRIMFLFNDIVLIVKETKFRGFRCKSELAITGDMLAVQQDTSIAQKGTTNGVEIKRLVSSSVYPISQTRLLLYCTSESEQKRVISEFNDQVRQRPIQMDNKDEISDANFKRRTISRSKSAGHASATTTRDLSPQNLVRDLKSLHKDRRSLWSPKPALLVEKLS